MIDKNIMIYKNIIYDTVGSKTKLKDVLATIKDGNPKLIKDCEFLRNEPDKDIRNDYKKNYLPYVLFQGVFKKRGIKYLEEANGLMILDFDDGLGSEIREDIQKNKSVVATFISPSGGLKILIKIPKVKNDQEYKICYVHAEKIFKHKLDKANKDISRACFLSYDPNLYYNDNAEELQVNWDVDLQSIKLNTKSDIKKTLESNISKGERNNSLFKTACSFKSKGITYDVAFETIKNVNSNFEDPLNPEELKRIIDSAYTYANNIDTIQELKDRVFESIADKKRDKATELIVRYIKNNNHIYSIRQDDKQEMWIYREGIYVPEAITYIREFCRKVFRNIYNSNLTKQVVDKIEAETYIEKDKFFEIGNPSRVAVKNGILNVIEKKIYPFDPKEIHFNKINATFNPSAQCPTIEKHFSEVLKDEKDVPVIYEFFGYCLYRDYKIEKAFMLFGDGRNGKGKSVELLKRFLGSDNCCNISLEQIEKDSFGLANFQNKMANIGADISATALRNTGNFKQLTGHDMITTNRKNKSYVSFINYAKLIFCANELPQTKDTSAAFWNRWVLLEFPYTFLPQAEIDLLPSQNKHLIKLADPEHINKLLDEEELSGLLNKSLIGLERLFKNKDFSNSNGFNAIELKWVRASDSSLSFFIDCIEINYDAEIESTDLKKYYFDYCKQHKLKTVNEKTLYQKLRDHFPTELRRIRNITNDYYAWQSIIKKGIIP